MIASCAQKNELLFGFGVNFNDLPTWQKRGIGLYWEEYDKPVVDRGSGQETLSTRRRIKVVHDLPMKDSYNDFLAKLIADATEAPYRDQK